LIFRTFILLLTLLILPLVIRKFKKTVDPKIDDLYQHLQGIGIKVFIAEKGNDATKIELGDIMLPTL
jgi:hypothetical protein